MSAPADLAALLARAKAMLRRYRGALEPIAGAGSGEKYETAREYAQDAIALPLDDYYELDAAISAALAGKKGAP